MARRVAPIAGDPGVSYQDQVKHMVYGFAMAPLQMVNPYFWTRVYYGDVSAAEHLEHASYAVVWAGASAGVAIYTGTVITPSQAYSFYAGAVARTPILAVPLALAAPITAGYAANVVAAQKMPTHERPSFWRSVGQALTGTGPGVGSWTP